MQGMCKETGKPIFGEAYIKQSIEDILSTPTGSRLFLRDYGCDLQPFIDQGINDKTWIDVASEIQRAITKWEPRFIFDGASLDENLSDRESGKLVIVLSGRTVSGNHLQLRTVIQ